MLDTNVRGLSKLDNMIGAEEKVKKCGKLDTGYCTAKSKWCHLIKVCDVKTPTKSKTRSTTPSPERWDHAKALRHYKALWCSVTYSGNILAIAYNKHLKRTCNIGTFTKLSDALVAQRDYCKENNTPFRNKHVNIDDVIKFEQTGVLPE